MRISRILAGAAMALALFGALPMTFGTHATAGVYADLGPDNTQSKH
jgi:hypothetical protein